MLSFSWTNVLKNLFAGIRASRAPKRKGLRGRISAASSEALEQRVLLSAVTFSVDEVVAEGKKNNEDATPKGGKKKQTVVDNPGGLSTSVLYPSLIVDVQPGETVLLGTVQVSRAKGKFYFGGVRIGGEDFGDIFGDVWIADGGRILDKVSANADTVDLGRSSVQVAKKTTKTLQIYGQAESTLVTMEGTFSVIHAQYRLLKNKPNFVHLYGAGSATPKIHANGPIIVNPNPAGFTVFPGDQNVEEGTNSSVGAVLDTQPTSNVTLNFNLTSGPISLASSSVTFTPQNWNIPQYVTLNAPENAVDQPDQTQTLTVSVNDALSDNAFDPLADEVFMYGFSDNDPTVVPKGTIDLIVTPSSGVEGSQFTAVVNLSSTAAGNVTVELANNGGLTGATTLVFSPGETSKTVTWTAPDDGTDEPDQVVTITATATAGSDPEFSSVFDTATVTVIDNDPTVDPNPMGPEISRFITYLGTTSGILKVKSFTFATNLTSLTHTKAAYDFDGNGDVGSQASEYLSTTVSNVVNGQVTISFDLEIGPGSYGFQIRSRHPGIQNATFTPVSAVVETLDGQTKLVTFTQNPAGGPWFYDTTIAA